MEGVNHALPSPQSSSRRLPDGNITVDPSGYTSLDWNTGGTELTVTFTEPIGEEDVRKILSQAPGVKIVDDRQNNRFPMPLEATGQDDILVGRIRQDISQPDGRGIEMFVSGDQIRKGAALNAVQIAERLAG